MNKSDQNSGTRIRVPAEWEHHAATWMQWPTRHETKLRPAFTEIINVIQKYEPLHLLTNTESEKAKAEQMLSEKGVPKRNITWHILPVDNAWMRDNGPVYLTDGRKTWIQNWKFNAWGGHFGEGTPYENDNLVPDYVAGYLDITIENHQDYILEKGNLEFNGVGVLVLNWDCQEDRNPGMTQAEHEAILKVAFGLNKIIWAYGHVSGEGTVGHIDGTARFINRETIAIADSSWGAKNQNDLAKACQETGLKVVRIPCPGETDYMNWFVGNGFVAGMLFGDQAADAIARSMLESLFPDRVVHMLDASTLWSEGGGIHCITNDQPLLE
jgi:agmatine deiminase